MSFLGMDPPRQTAAALAGLQGLHPAPGRRARAADPAAHRPLPRPVPASTGELRLDRRLRRQAADGRHLRDDGRAGGRPRRGTPARRPASCTARPGVRDVPRGRHGGGARRWSATTPTCSSSGRSSRPTTSPARCSPPRIDGDRLTDEEIIAFLFLMVVAGNETTTKLLGHALFHLTRHPEQLRPGLRRTRRRRRWSCRGSRRRCATTPPASCSRGTCSRTSSCTARSRRAGSKLLLVLGSANRDDRVFTDPDRYDIFRDKDELAPAAQLRRRPALLPRRQPGPARGAGRAARAGPPGRHASRSTTTACRRVHSVNVRGFASVPVRMEVR